MRSAIIIGAGPAGSVAALLLAGANWQVTLIEQHRFPRDKVCGECLSSLGFDVLHRHGLAKAVREAGAVELTHTLLHAADGAAAQIALPRPMWGISRATLDTILLNAARNAGVTVLQPWRCEALSNTPCPSVTARDLSNNKVQTLQADWLLLADGKGALLNRAATASDDFGLQAHFAQISTAGNAIELFGVHGHYGGLAPVEHDRWNLAFGIPRAMLGTFGGNLDALCAGIVGQNNALARRLAGAKRVGRWLVSPLPRFSVSARWPRRIIPLGNAAAALEPVGGEGMGLAIRSAELAAASLAGGGSIEELHDRMAHLWRFRSLACRAAALVLSSPTILPLSLKLTSLSRVPGVMALRAMGKASIAQAPA